MNKITIRQHFPFPSTQNIFIDLKGSKIFSQIDLAMGFHQIQIAPEDTQKTAFSINGKKYEYLRLPFGMKNPAFSFQAEMVRLLGHLNYVKIFVDDLLIFSSNEKEHLSHLTEVLNVLRENSVCINFEKSSFNRKNVKILGQNVSKDGIIADLKPIEI